MTSLGAVLVIGYPSCISELVSSLFLKSGRTVYLLLSQEDVSRVAPLKMRFGQQLQLLIGRGAHLDFGLGGHEYLMLADQVEYVLSLYAMGEGDRDAEFGPLHAQELVEFCKVAVRLKKLLFLSDFSFSAGCDGVFAERDMAWTVSSTAVNQTSLRVEKVLNRFAQTTPIVIVRCGTMVGERESLFPLVMTSLGYPELFSKRDVSLLLADVEWAAGCIVEICLCEESGHTFHLFQLSVSLSSVGIKLMQLGLAQVPGTYDLRSSARRRLRLQGGGARQLGAVQIDARVENSWTKQYFRAHNFSNWDKELDWQPLIEYEVELLTGFR